MSNHLLLFTFSCGFVAALLSIMFFFYIDMSSYMFILSLVVSISFSQADQTSADQLCAGILHDSCHKNLC